ncbi:MAG TPA: tetratricopeptide repeat protein [Nitrospira sp.]|nr:tetratricopeptide repeat protein [Nitrospira sp.]
MDLMRVTVAGSLVILQCACAVMDPPLSAPPGSNVTAAQHNSDGIAHYELGHWSIAKDHFTSAVEADPNLAEAHYNLGLALNQLNLQSEATTHFKKAADLAPANNAIVQSRAYRSRTAPPSPSSSGTSGYGGMGY